MDPTEEAIARVRMALVLISQAQERLDQEGRTREADSIWKARRELVSALAALGYDATETNSDCPAWDRHPCATAVRALGADLVADMMDAGSRGFFRVAALPGLPPDVAVMKGAGDTWVVLKGING